MSASVLSFKTTRTSEGRTMEASYRLTVTEDNLEGR